MLESSRGYWHRFASDEARIAIPYCGAEMRLCARLILIPNKIVNNKIIQVTGDHHATTRQWKRPD